MELEGAWSHGFTPLSGDFAASGNERMEGYGRIVLAMTPLSLAEDEEVCIDPGCFTSLMPSSSAWWWQGQNWAEMPGAVTQGSCDLLRASHALFVHVTHCKPLFPPELQQSHIHTCISFVLAIWGGFSCFRRFKQTM